MKVPFVDFGRMHNDLKDEFLKTFEEALGCNGFVMGAAVAGFEAEFATYCEAKHAVGVGSGTDALVLALRALDVGAGDEVITAPNSFIATAAAIAFVGAKPVFVDVDEDTQLLTAELIAPAITDRTKVIIPVHLFGQPVDLDPIIALAKERGLKVLEDAAQAHGARYKGARVGSGDTAGACWSFYAGKNLGALGEGGMVTTNDAEMETRLRRLREHGQDVKYYHDELGYNSRLDAIQARFLSLKLAKLDEWNASRVRAAEQYDAALKDVEGVKLVKQLDSSESVYHLYVIRVANRDSFQKKLGDLGIASGIHYPVPIHAQKAFSNLNYQPGDFPITEELAADIVSLPIFPGITSEEVDTVIAAVKEVLV